MDGDILKLMTSIILLPDKLKGIFNYLNVRWKFSNEIIKTAVTSETF